MSGPTRTTAMSFLRAWIALYALGAGACILPDVSKREPKPAADASDALPIGAISETGSADKLLNDQSSSSAQPGHASMAGLGAAPGAVPPMNVGGSSSPTAPPPVTTAPALGGACTEQNVIACAGSNSYARLRCLGGAWAPYDDCPDGDAARCVMLPGAAAPSCQYQTKGCDASHSQTRICVGANVHVCDEGNGTSFLTQACTGDTPDCMSGECACFSRCSGSCSSLQWDSQNCGSCGHTCQGGICTSGVCGPAKIVRNALAGYSIFLDGTYLYWVTTPDAYLMRVPLEGGEPYKLATLDGDVNNMLSDGSHVYVTRPKPGTLTQIDVKTGQVMVLAAGQVEIRGLTVDAENVYWLRGKIVFNGEPLPATPYEHDVLKLPKVGGTPQVLVTSTNLDKLIEHGEFLYFTSAYKLYRTAKTGGTPTLLVDGDGAASELQISGDRIYYTAPVRQVFSLPLAGGTPTHLFDLGLPANVLVDGQFAYVMGVGPNATLSRYALTVGAMPTTILPAPSRYGFAINDRFIFFGVADSIYGMPKALAASP